MYMYMFSLASHKLCSPIQCCYCPSQVSPVWSCRVRKKYVRSFKAPKHQVKRLKNIYYKERNVHRVYNRHMPAHPISKGRYRLSRTCSFLQLSLLINIHRRTLLACSPVSSEFNTLACPCSTT